MEEIKNGEGKFIFCCGEEKRRKLIGKGKHIFAEEKKNKVVKGGNIWRRNIYFCGGEGKEKKNGNGNIYFAKQNILHFVILVIFVIFVIFWYPPSYLECKSRLDSDYIAHCWCFSYSLDVIVFSSYL